MTNIANDTKTLVNDTADAAKTDIVELTSEQLDDVSGAARVRLFWGLIDIQW